jgi:glycerol-3-phosphate dehydrogenase (NAD(P)+)
VTPLSVAVVGAGNWGTVLAHLVARNGHTVRLWMRDVEVCAEIATRRTHTRSSPGLVLAEGIEATSDLRLAVRSADLVLVAIPAQAFREVARALGDVLTPEQLVIHGTKGIENGSLARASEILEQETCARQIGALAGPNIAIEVAAGKPAGTMIASHFPRVIEVGRRALASPQMMVFAGEDVVGVEVSGALKNVVAIAAGAATALEVGENAKAFLVTRGLAEITRVGIALGADPATFAGLAGLGDLVVTCASSHSRNHRVGVALARGERLDDALRAMGMVAEGVATSVSARALAAAQGIETPLLSRVHAVVHEGLSPREALQQLMALPAGRDVARR